MKEPFRTEPAPARDDQAFQARTDALLAELNEIAVRQSWQGKWLSPLLMLYRCFLAGYAALVILNMLWHLPTPMHPDGPMLPPLLQLTLYSGLLWALVGDFMIGKTRARIKKLVVELSADVRAAGAIAQVCYSAPFLSVADIAVPALVKLLPRVKASDARYFSDDQMRGLLGMLASHNPYRVNLRQFPDLPLAVLKALEQIGDSRAIEPVRRLTTGKKNRPYHQAAQECLGYLEQIEQQDATREYHRSLLLPSAENAGKETLLRAAMPQAERQPELLLRAAQSKERE